MVANSEYIKQLLLERERFDNPPDHTIKATGVGIARFIVRCQNNVDEVLNLAKRVLVIVNYNSESIWPSFNIWSKILPETFINNCASEISQSESEKKIAYRRSLSWEKQVSLEKNEKWSLGNWIAWLEPDAREWFWWNAHKFDGEIENTHFLVEVTALHDPFSSGALKWLFKACGAIDVVSIDDF